MRQTHATVCLLLVRRAVKDVRQYSPVFYLSSSLVEGASFPSVVLPPFDLFIKAAAPPFARLFAEERGAAQEVMFTVIICLYFLAYLFQPVPWITPWMHLQLINRKSPR